MIYDRVLNASVSTDIVARCQKTVVYVIGIIVRGASASNCKFDSFSYFSTDMLTILIISAKFNIQFGDKPNTLQFFKILVVF